MITKNTTTLVEITGDVEASCWNDYKHSDCLEMTFKMTGDDDNEVKYNIYINYDRALRLLLEMKKRLTEKHKETVKRWNDSIVKTETEKKESE